MFDKEIKTITDNIDKTININLPNLVKCRIIGYGITKSPINNTLQLKVLVWKNHNSSGYRFPYKLLKDFTILSMEENMNPDDFVAVPYNCIKTNHNGIMISCY